MGLVEGLGLLLVVIHGKYGELGIERAEFVEDFAQEGKGLLLVGGVALEFGGLGFRVVKLDGAARAPEFGGVEGGAF